MRITPTAKPKRAPELDGARAWLNVRQPLHLHDLKGSVVLLDFWTYCCINCMHVLPTLRELEHRYRDQPLVVIGVHSGKFSAERDPARIREAIGRYGVEHPVVVDEDFNIWDSYGVRSWPTLVVIRPDGMVAAVAPGEPELDTLDAFVGELIEEARAAGTLAVVPPNIEPAAPTEHKPISYPGKAICMPDGRLAISDSGHHRVLICERSGEVALAVGSGLRGMADGAADEAAFDDPQGLCFYSGQLYVTDTRNHAIRRIDPDSGEVTRVAGTGVLGVEPHEGRMGATEVALRSPWDLCPVDDVIYVAMAGSHQLYRFYPEVGEIEVYAGTGVEALLDGAVAASAWAQPSGLSHRDGTLYVADSETSAVRAVDLETDTVRTLVGQGLFDFGDGEGDAGEALLQHCLDVVAVSDGVLIADTYNGKIKRWTARQDSSGEIHTVLDGFHEPASIDVAPDGTWFITDTNAHRIVEVVGGQRSTIPIHGAPAPKRGALTELARGEAELSTKGWFTNLIELPQGVGLRPGRGGVSLYLRSPEGSELAQGSSLHVAVEVSRRSDLLMVDKPTFSVTARGGPSQVIHIEVRVGKFDKAAIEAELVARVDYVACRADNVAVCTPERAHLRVPVRLLSAGEDNRLELVIDLAGARVG